MNPGRYSIVLLLTAGAFALQDYAPDKENVVFKTQIGKQIHKEDVQCGDYFWRSVKADAKGIPTVYYFYGDPAYGKNKLGLYYQRLYKVVVDAQKDPPTVQVIRDGEGTLKEVRVRMTQAQLSASRVCFPE
jgi:hypothetical protein